MSEFMTIGGSVRRHDVNWEIQWFLAKPLLLDVGVRISPPDGYPTLKVSSLESPCKTLLPDYLDISFACGNRPT